MSEIISITPKLKERAAERAEYFQHMDRKLAMLRILSSTIAEMCELGEPPESVAATLRHAASVLEE